MHRHLFIAGLALTLAGCATTYGEIGGWIGDGVSAEALTADIVRIRSRGNSNTEAATVADFALLRAAETARSRCATHFVVLERSDRTRVEEVVTPETVTKTVEEREVDGKTQRVEHRTVTPGSVSLDIRPGEDLIVRMLTVSAAGTPPPGAFRTDEVLAEVSPRVVRRKKSPPVVFPAC